MGTSSINGPFSMAMFNNQRVTKIMTHENQSTDRSPVPPWNHGALPIAAPRASSRSPPTNVPRKRGPTKKGRS